jgi:hypothetical protein
VNQEVLFGESDDNRRKKLMALWKLCAPCSTRELTERAVDAGLWDDEDDVRALKVKAHIPEVRLFLDWVNPITGIQNGYKTQEGTRKPFQMSMFEDLEFDIQADANAADADRERLRHKIRVCLATHQRRPPVAAWLWGPDDDAQWNERRLDDAAD